MVPLTKTQMLIVYVLSLLALMWFVSTKPKMLQDQKKKGELSGVSVTLAFVVVNVLLYFVVKALGKMKGGRSMMGGGSSGGMGGGGQMGGQMGPPGGELEMTDPSSSA